MLSDIEIAQSAEMKKIEDIAKKLDVSYEEIEPYGHYKAKLSQKLFDRVKDISDGKLVLVTAINPTPAGEGKTTISVGLADGLAKIGKKTVLALREPSLGPVFGLKGGAAGGGYAQVVPMEDINLHFTGDMHAITAANNLICALLDNHIQQGNELGIDPRRVEIKRCVDINDRVLRDIVVGLGGKKNGVPREDGFMITVASEIMAILCLSNDISDLKNRIGRILIAYNYDGEPIRFEQIGGVGAVTALLKDAVNPNLVQTLENTPAIIHGGPFANIAHGCNSVRATKLALKLGDYTVTEAGFGADLGAEKFFDIKCRFAGFKPSCVVLVATVRALKYNGGVAKPDLATPDVEALKRGIVNLQTHIENLNKFGLPVVVAINRFATDSDEELNYIKEFCNSFGASCTLCEAHAKGGEGSTELAKTVCNTIETAENSFCHLYDEKLTIQEKINKIATEIYRANGVEYTAAAKKSIKEIEDLGLDKIPICVAKTQYSLSDDAKKLGKPENFNITVRDVAVRTGAGFIVVFTGEILTMPGLPKVPAANNIDIDDKGTITGLF